jgi:cell division protein FtsZ
MEDIYNNYHSQNVSSEVKSVDQELEELLKKQSAKIKVVGVGGSGNNSLNRMKEIGIKGGELIAINTDAQDLLYTNADSKILIGKELTKGLGAGSNPKIGEEAAKESESDIKKKLSGSDMIFITCGLGGGTGTGAAPVIASLAKKQNALTIAVVTMPFTIEGKKRIENAMNGLEKLESVVDTLIVIPNDKLLELAPDLPLHTAFKIADEILTNAVKGVTELVTTSGLVNLDFADIKSVMVDGGVSLIGLGEADSTNRAFEAVEKAINNPLLDVDISEATGALINIVGGNDMSLDECKIIVENVGKKLSGEAKIIWGAQISADMDKSIRVLLIVTGVKSSQILGHGESMEDIKHREIEEELGIEFFE